MVVCALLVVGDAVVFRPNAKHLRELSLELAVAEQEYAYIESNPEHMARVDEFLPGPVEGANGGEQLFLAAISGQLRDSGMILTKVEPKRVRQDGSYTRRTFKLEIEGGYRQFAGFLRYLETMSEVVIVNSFELYSKHVRRGDRHACMMVVTVIGY